MTKTLIELLKRYKKAIDKLEASINKDDEEYYLRKVEVCESKLWKYLRTHDIEDN